LDRTDFEIIKILCKDARTPFKRIGRMLGIGTDTVFRRFKKLERDGLILGSTTILSSKACGFQGLFGIFIKLRAGASVEAVTDKLAKLPHITDFIQILGDYDFYADLYFRDFETILFFISKLREIEEIDSISPMLYTTREWSLPFILSYEFEVPNWAFRIENGKVRDQKGSE
jgi:Lrp/AsnC family transcriptional regulator for asnA, asnC and gidA